MAGMQQSPVSAARFARVMAELEEARGGSPNLPPAASPSPAPATSILPSAANVCGDQASSFTLAGIDTSSLSARTLAVLESSLVSGRIALQRHEERLQERQHAASLGSGSSPLSSIFSTSPSSNQNSRIESAPTSLGSKHGKRESPWSCNSYLQRVQTYSTCLWFGKPERLSPLQCARWGWTCVGLDTLRCTTCRGRVYFRDENGDVDGTGRKRKRKGGEEGSKRRKKVSKSAPSCSAEIADAQPKDSSEEKAILCASTSNLMLNDGHLDCCRWRDQPCPSIFASALASPRLDHPALLSQLADTSSASYREVVAEEFLSQWRSRHQSLGRGLVGAKIVDPDSTPHLQQCSPPSASPAEPREYLLSSSFMKSLPDMILSLSPSLLALLKRSVEGSAQHGSVSDNAEMNEGASHNERRCLAALQRLLLFYIPSCTNEPLHEGLSSSDLIATATSEFSISALLLSLFGWQRKPRTEKASSAETKEEERAVLINLPDSSHSGSLQCHICQATVDVNYMTKQEALQFKKIWAANLKDNFSRDVGGGEVNKRWPLFKNGLKIHPMEGHRVYCPWGRRAPLTSSMRCESGQLDNAIVFSRWVELTGSCGWGALLGALAYLRVQRKTALSYSESTRRPNQVENNGNDKDHTTSTPQEMYRRVREILG